MLRNSEFGEELLRTPLAWRLTGHFDPRYESQFQGKRLLVCDNDWPEYEDFRFYVSMDGDAVASFNGWPKCWRKPRDNWRLHVILLRHAFKNISLGLFEELQSFLRAMRWRFRWKAVGRGDVGERGRGRRR